MKTDKKFASVDDKNYSFPEKGAREKIDHLNKTISETELSRQNAITHWQQEAENIRQNYRVHISF